MSVAINFFARQVGLGNVGQKVREIIQRVRVRVDAAVNKLIEYVVGQGNNWLASVSKAGGRNRGDRSSATPQRRPNPVGRNNQRVVQNNRSNPQQRQPCSVTPNNRKPTPNHRQNPQQKTPIPVRPNNRKPAPTTVPAPANRNKPSGDRPSQNQQQTPALTSYDRQIGKEVRFKAGDENHRLWFEMQQSKPALMVASAKQHLETFLNSQQVLAAFPKPEEYSAVVEVALSIARSAQLNAQSLHQILTAASSRDPQNQQAIVQKDNQIEVQQDSLVPLMRQIFNKLAQPSSEQETLQLRVRVERLKENAKKLISQIQSDNRLKTLRYEVEALEKDIEEVAQSLENPNELKELEPFIEEQENDINNLEIKVKLPQRIDTLVTNSQSLSQEIKTVVELNQYEQDALNKPEPLNKDDRKDKSIAQLKQQARGELQPEAQKLVQEADNLRKLLGNLDSLVQREAEIKAQENNYQELKTKLDNYKDLLKVDNSSSERLEGNSKLKSKEPRDQFRLVETMADYEKQYPRAVQEVINAAQDSVTQLNKATSRYGDGSVAYAAIAEQVNGSNIARKFDAPEVALPGLGEQAHLEKCKDFITALGRSIRKLSEEYVATHLTQKAIKILSREQEKLKQAAKWCSDYRAGNYPELPDWAKPYRQQLKDLGLQEIGKNFN